MDFGFSVITGHTVHALLTPRKRECVEIVRQAYLAHHARHSVNPNSYFLRFPEKPSARIIALPAYLGDRFNVSGIKWIASYPENVAAGFPRASAVLILNDYETGYPFACLESSIISAARTAASAVLGAERLSPEGRRARAVGIVGNGLIARYVYDFLIGTGWEIEAVRLFDTRAGESERFRDEVCDASRHRQIEVMPEGDALLRSCDLIVLTTVAPRPYILDGSLLAHNPVVLNLSLRDLAPEILLGSYNIVDDVDHVMQANSSPHLAEQLTGNRDFITGTLAGLISGECAIGRDKPVVFSPFGLGILDLAVGKWIHDLAKERGDVVAVNGFFHDVTR
ncbi:2,3-diaminopropionate biosynthesis protein SbnB [Chondromyces apiculatus]|uniref:Ornithine cyclodeaminase n=1 Tax=Chondromyces apiculatus DSM 436 TaxID=1192034 RepID=A0A017T909_9BACT|nr:2,3-diaminopropionate biosynthesis protein SbnB [Chondromyces apiculatus]EYF05056.1 Ornithine cyclodeaminase [Chondromyces apiculatus DSM 436]